MNKRIVLLNGPPDCGKDFIADQLQERLGGVKQMFKRALYEHTADFFKMDREVFTALAMDRDTKEVATAGILLYHDDYCSLMEYLKKPNPEYGGVRAISPRQAMIYVSELVYKPEFGNDYFGQETAKGMKPGNNFVSDSGFIEEALVQVEEFGKENVVLIRIHADGCNFDNDSRDYIDLADKGVACLDVFNDKETDQACRMIMDHMYVNLVKG